MVYDRERDQRDRAVYAEHQTAVAAGEKRVLRRTKTGELYSYPRDEIGFTPGRGHAQVSTWWGMGILLVFSVLLFIWGCWMLLSPIWDGEGPFWGALWIIGMTGFLTPYALILARAEYRGKQLRKLRGSPEPGTGNLNAHFPNLDQNAPDRPKTST